MPFPEIAEKTTPAGANNDRLFFRIASFSTSLAFGGMLASIEALYKNASGFAFHASSGTLVAFAIGFVIGSIYWRIASLNSTARTSLLLRGTATLLMLGGVAAFLYPLRFLPTEKLPDVFKGLATAAVTLSVLAYMLWRFKTFFDQDAATVEQRKQD